MAGSYAIGIIGATGKVDTSGSETEGGGDKEVTATAVSEDYQTSIKKATLIAKAELADKISGNITTKEFRKKIEKIEAGEIQSAEEFESTIIGKVNEQTIKGYNQEEILTIPEGALFRTFILLKKSM